MDLIMLSTVVGQLAIIGSDPALGYRGQAITSALSLLATIIARGTEAQGELKELADHIAFMVGENREPTKDEWYAFRDLSKKYHDILNSPEPTESTDADRAELVEGVTRHMREGALEEESPDKLPD